MKGEQFHTLDDLDHFFLIRIDVFNVTCRISKVVPSLSIRLHLNVLSLSFGLKGTDNYFILNRYVVTTHLPI